MKRRIVNLSPMNVKRKTVETRSIKNCKGVPTLFSLLRRLPQHIKLIELIPELLKDCVKIALRQLQDKTAAQHPVSIKFIKTKILIFPRVTATL